MKKATVDPNLKKKQQGGKEEKSPRCHQETKGEYGATPSNDWARGGRTYVKKGGGELAAYCTKREEKTRVYQADGLVGKKLETKD